MKRKALLVSLAAAAPLAAAFASLAAGAGADQNPPPPTTVTATKLAADKPPYAVRGTVISASTLANRVFVNHSDGVSISAYKDAQYAACTTDSGRIWKVCSPHVHVNAADAPDVITEVGADGGTRYLYAGPTGGDSVVVSTNTVDWYRARFQHPVAMVVDDVLAPKQTIDVFDDSPSGILLYQSSDGGKTWKLG